MTLAAVERLLGLLGSMPLARRLEWPALEPERADVIIGGGGRARRGDDDARLRRADGSESDLLDGIAAELLAV